MCENIISIDNKRFSRKKAKQLHEKDIAKCIEYLNNYFFITNYGTYLYRAIDQDGITTYHEGKSIRQISEGRFPLDLEVTTTKINGNKTITTTRAFKPNDYLGSFEFMDNQRVKRVVEMDKPPIFVNKKGNKCVNEALPHPNLHKLTVPPSVKQQYQKNLDFFA